MLHKKLIAGLCFTICIAIREVELTPIVTIQPEIVVESTSLTTENTAIKTTTSEIPVISAIVISTTEIIGRDVPRKLGESETQLTDVPLKANDSSSSSINVTTAVIQPVTIAGDIDNQTNVHEATTPELITKTVIGSGTPFGDNDTETDVAQLSVTSQPLILKQVEEKLEEESVTVIPQVLAENQTVVKTTVKIEVSTAASSNVTEGDYKDKAPPEYHPYIEEILKHDEPDETVSSTQAAPTRIKSKGYSSPQNTLEHHPYGPLPKFAEKEMDKLRLNHWRVNQILKGSGSHYDHSSGRHGTGKGIAQGNQQKYNPTTSSFVGQKRASSTGVTASSVVKSSLVDQDEFHTSVLASDVDAAIENDTTSPSKLRTFFNWISNPLKKKTSEEDERLKQAKAQQPILPFALGYRGDFLFW